MWSLGITAYELAIGEPPHSKLHSMRAAIKIPTSPPPTLPDPARFSSDFHSFLAACLVKDFEARPSAGSLLSHPFILKAPGESILTENVRAAMAELESKHENLDEINGLMNAHTIRPGGSNANTGDKKSMRGVSSTRGGDESSRTSDTLDPNDLDNDFAGDFSSDTMVQAGCSDTMVHSGGGGGGDANATMIMGGGSSAAPAAAAAAAPAKAVASPSHASDTMIFGNQPVAEDPSEEGLSQFSDDDDDEGELPELRITEEGDAQ